VSLTSRAMRSHRTSGDAGDDSPAIHAPCVCCEGESFSGRWPGFLICRGCGLMVFDQRFDVAGLKSLYQESYFRGNEYIDYLAERVSQQRTLQQHLRVVRRHLQPGARLLEVGCAYGYFLEMIRADFPDSIGIDVSSAAIAYARERGLDAREGDLLDFTWERPFDAVCLWDTIEHLPHPDRVVQRAAESLAPGGYLMLTTGDFGALLPRLQGLRWRQIHPPTHLYYFTRPSLRALCRRVGLDVVSFTTVCVHRRLSSALLALERFHAGSPAGRTAKVLSRVLPAALLEWDVPLDLGDTLCLVARRAGPPAVP
jgi:SAM-dependent methyltransferase